MLEKLLEDFPDLYRQIDDMPGDGWESILRRLSERLTDLIQVEAIPDQYFATQIKEKFGGLRFYMSSETDDMSKAISEAEDESFRTCEVCGAPGKTRREGWIKVRCKEHP